MGKDVYGNAQDQFGAIAAEVDKMIKQDYGDEYAHDHPELLFAGIQAFATVLLSD